MTQNSARSMTVYRSWIHHAMIAAGRLRVGQPATIRSGLHCAFAAFLLVAAQGRHSYGFYVVLRLLATVGAVYWAARVYQAGPRGWAWAFAAVALLMNPILPVRMHRSDWQPIDLWLGILLLGWSGYWLVRRSRRR